MAEERKGTQRLTRLLVLALICLGAAGCGTDDGSEGAGLRTPTGLEKCTVKLDGYHYIGYALKGTSEKAGLVKKAVLLALTEINEAGGINGRPIGLVECDTQGDETAAQDAIAELGGVVPMSGIVGTGASGTMVAAFDEAVAAKKVLISPAATSPQITDLDDDGYACRTAVSDSFQGNILARIAIREGFKRIFIINLDNAWGNGLRDVFTTEFNRLWEEDGADGVEVSGESYVDAATFDADALVTAGMDYAPDAVLLITFADTGAAVVKTATNEGWAPAWLLTDGVKSPNLLEKVGGPEALEGALGTAPAPPIGPLYEAFDAAFQDAWAEAPFTFAATGYDATYLLAIAMAFADDPDSGEQVRDNLVKTSGGSAEILPGGWSDFLEALDAGTAVDYRGASGEVDLDANGDVTGNIEEWAVREGEFVTEGCWTPEGTACPE